MSGIIVRYIYTPDLLGTRPMDSYRDRIAQNLPRGLLTTPEPEGILHDTRHITMVIVN